MTVTLYQGDARQVLRTLPARSVQCVVTSPPYFGLRDYRTATWEGGDPGCSHLPSDTPLRRGVASSGLEGGQGNNGHKQEGYKDICPRCGARRIDRQIGMEATPQLYVAHIVEVMREVRRVLRDDGVLWLNLGDSFASGKGTCRNPGGGATSLENHNAVKEACGYPLDRGNRSTLAACGLKPKDLVGIPWMVAFALRDDGWWLRQDVIWAKGLSFCPTYAGSSMPESVQDRPSTTHEHIFLLTKAERYFYDQEAVKEPAVGQNEHDLTGTGYTAPGQTPQRGNRGRGGRSAFRGQGHFRMEESGPANRDGRDMRDVGAGPTRNLRSVWAICPGSYPGNHFATFPEDLVVPMIRAGTSEKGCCPLCGAPWQRVAKRVFVPQEDIKDPAKLAKGGRKGLDASNGWGDAPRGTNETTTLGWAPTCDCDAGDPVPCVVLDPFGGSGTVGAVANGLGRDAILIDLSPEYIGLQKERIGLFAEEAAPA